MKSPLVIEITSLVIVQCMNDTHMTIRRTEQIPGGYVVIVADDENHQARVTIEVDPS